MYNGPLPSSGMVINNNPARSVVTPLALKVQAAITTGPTTPAATATVIPAVQTTVKPEAPAATQPPTITQSSKQQDSAVKSPQTKESVPEIPAIALINSVPTTSYIAGPIFVPVQTIIGSQSDTKMDLSGDKVKSDAEDIIAQAFSSVILPPGNDPDDDLEDDEKNIEKQEKVVSKDSPEARKQSKATPPRTSAQKQASALRKAERLAKEKIKLPDGRIRYYEAENPSSNPGPTRGSSFVTEFDPKTGRVRQWQECYDHYRNVNRGVLKR